MGYAAEVLAILDVLEQWLSSLSFKTVVRGWKADASEVKNMPVCFIVMRRDPLMEQAGARAENRRPIVELWTLNNKGHDEAITLAGEIVDEIDKDLTVGGTVAWARLQDVEYYVNVLRGFELHWSRIVYEMERRRMR